MLSFVIVISGCYNTPSSTSELVELAITSYLAYFTREEEVEQIYFFLAQYIVEFCPISKNLGNVLYTI